MSSVSVVIPCHNYGRFLGAAIDSVLGQDYEDLELIVVDDGSTDDTAQAAARYSSLDYVYEPNRGQGAAQNRGLEAANGEFVLFLDADDRLASGAVESFVGSMRVQDACAFAYGHVQLVDVDGAPITTRPSRSERLQTCHQGDPYAHMLRTNNSLRSSGAVFYRSELLKSAGGFAVDLGNCQDIDLNLRLAREHPICCVDRVVLVKRWHDDNSMLRAGPMLRGAVMAQRRQRDFVRRHPKYEADYRAGLEIARSYWGDLLAQRALAEARAGDIRASARDLATLLRWAPRSAAGTAVSVLRRSHTNVKRSRQNGQA